MPQISVPWGLHERLWPIKYIIFLGLFGLSLYSVALAEVLAEVEPFKTAIILKFVRDWPFVLYALTLLAAGLFIERFFCRYLCPLGAALAIPGRIRMFEWLKRWPECGSPCQRCANECPVQAIHPEGHINVNECIYCMHCQELYYDDQRCPHMIQVRLKREKREALSSPSMRGNKDGGAGPPKPVITHIGQTDRESDHTAMSRRLRKRRRNDNGRPRQEGLSRRDMLGTTAAVAPLERRGGRGVALRQSGVVTPAVAQTSPACSTPRRLQQVRGQTGRTR